MRLSSGTYLLLPFLGVMIVFFMAPMCIALAYSFMEAGPMGGVNPAFSLAGYQRFFYAEDAAGNMQWDTRYLQIIYNSTKMAVLATFICVAIGFPMAWFMATRPARQRDFWMILVTIPFWTNLLIRTFAIQEVIRNNGTINTVLQWLGLIDAPLQMMYTDFAILLGMAYVFMPLMVLPLYAAMDKLDFRLVEAGYDLYASRLQVLWHVILPLVKPGFIAGSILVFIPAIGAYVTPRVLGGGRTMMLGNLIALQFGQGRNWPLGAALAMLLLVIVVAALVFYLRWANREEGRANV